MDFNRYIDHTNLRPTATVEDIRKLCREAREYAFASVCVNATHAALAKELLAGSDVKVCVVIGFPLGAGTTASKVFETAEMRRLGCDEFDMVLNVGWMKDRRTEEILAEIRSVVQAANGGTVKVIIETGLLDQEEIALATRLVCEAGADFVKTCTGMSSGAATPEDVALMKANLSGKTKIKASGGIRTYEGALALVQAGAERLGASSGVAIMEQSRV